VLQPILLELGTERSKIMCCSINKGGTRFITSGDTIIRIWSINPPTCVGNLVAHNAPVRSVQWSNSGDRILSGSEDGAVRVWDYNGNNWDSKQCTNVC
jgi:WD40 repeat protein